MNAHELVIKHAKIHEICATEEVFDQWKQHYRPEWVTKTKKQGRKLSGQMEQDN